MDSDEERDWVRRASAGDRDAFAALVDRYWGSVRAWLTGLTGRVHLAEDLTQEAFLKAWVALPDLTAVEWFRVWLFRIARNEHLAAVRRPQTSGADAIPDAPDPAPDPASAAIEREEEAALRSRDRQVARLVPRSVPALDPREPDVPRNRPHFGSNRRNGAVARV